MVCGFADVRVDGFTGVRVPATHEYTEQGDSEFGVYLYVGDKGPSPLRPLLATLRVSRLSR